MDKLSPNTPPAEVRAWIDAQIASDTDFDDLRYLRLISEALTRYQDTLAQYLIWKARREEPLEN